MQKKIKLDVTPVSAVRTVQKDAVFFRIPMDQLRPAGKNRRIRIERYNRYKISVSALAKAAKFVPPEQGMHVIFHMPVPKSWPKHKKISSHMKLHMIRPDLDNLIKGFLDGLLAEDNFIADLRATKRWVNQESGYIEISISSPMLHSDDTLA